MFNYRLNPQAKISLQIARPVPGQGMQRVGIGQQSPPNAQAMFNHLFASGILETLALILQSSQVSAADIPPEHLKTLLHLGLLVPTELDLPERTYCCALPAFPDTPVCSAYLQTEQALPPALHGQFEWPYVFSQARPILWVDDPRTHLLWPYWLAPAVQAEAPAVDTGHTDLSFQGLCSPNLDFSLADIQGQLQRQGFAVLSQIVPSLQQQALRQYLRHLTAGGYFDQGSVQVPLRNVIHNEPVMFFILGQLTQLLNAVLPAPVKPSYTYLADYLGGAVLEKHVDREQCLWNVSLALDASPDPAVVEDWPIWLHVGAEAEPVSLRIGDAVLYSGSRIPHWREPLPLGQRVCMGLFHFVSPDFEGVLL